MKKVLPVLLCLLAFSSCIKDDIENCAAWMHFHFNYTYGGVNRFFDMEKTDLTMHFYRVGEPLRYRELSVDRNSIGLQSPLSIEKEPLDQGSLNIISWSTDPALEYVNTPETPLGEGYVRLKEMTEGSGICRPVDDLFYANQIVEAGNRYTREDVTLSYRRPICRMRVTMMPGSIHQTGGIAPSPEDYSFNIYGTPGMMDDFAQTKGENIILRPICFFDEESSYVRTNWFGAFPSEQYNYLHVDVFVRDDKVAEFDCAPPTGIASKAGDYIDLYIDGRYIHPQMEVQVNGWKMATVISNM